MNGKKEEPKDEKFKPYIAKPTVDNLNCRKGAGTEYDVECAIDKDTAITIVAEVKAKDGGIWLRCKSGYYVNKKYMKFVKYVQKEGVCIMAGCGSKKPKKKGKGKKPKK